MTIEQINEKIRFFNEKILLTEDEFQDFAFTFDDSNDSETLIEYNTILNKYFDLTDSDSLLDFKKTKSNLIKEFEDNTSETYERLTSLQPELNVRHIKKEFEYVALIEMVFIEKYKKLIKKSINKTINNRVIGNAGDILGTVDNTAMGSKGPTRQEKLKEEALSYAIEGFLLGMRRYQPSSGTKLITYVTYWINQRIVTYVERASSLNKGKKTFDGLADYDMDNQESETGYKKYDNIKYTNYSFVNIGDMSTSLSVDNDYVIDSADDKAKLLKILRFFCENKDLLLYYEYLILKYDILYETYLYFAVFSPVEEVQKCFFEDVQKIIDKLSPQYPELEGFEPHENYNKLPELLELFFNLEHSDYLSIRRTLKQKFVNILTKVFSHDIDFQ